MAKIKDEISIFSDHGCLSEVGLLHYANNSLNETDMGLINFHIKECLVCKNAIDGMSGFQSDNQFRSGVQALRTMRKSKYQDKLRSSKVFFTGTVTIAATLLIIGGIYFLLQNQKRIRYDQVSKLLLQGELIKKSFLDKSELLIPIQFQSAPNSDVMEDNIRKSFIETKIKEKEESIPVALMDETHVFADTLINIIRVEESEVPKTKLIRKPVLRYPFRAMSMPPPENHPNESIDSKTRFSFRLVEVMPRFLHGNANDFGNYLYNNLKYPSQALENNIAGRVYVQFTIGNDGWVRDVSILKSDHYSLNDAVLDVIKDSPRWEAGMQGNRNVPVSLVMPVDFRLH